MLGRGVVAAGVGDKAEVVGRVLVAGLDLQRIFVGARCVVGAAGRLCEDAALYGGLGALLRRLAAAACGGGQNKQQTAESNAQAHHA